jgi:hypothetical protein
MYSTEYILLFDDAGLALNLDAPCASPDLCLCLFPRRLRARC